MSTLIQPMPYSLTGPELRYRGVLPPGIPVRQPRTLAAPSCPPTGYVISKIGDGRSVELDPVLASLVREAFEAAAREDCTVRSLLSRMTARGLVSRAGRPMSVSSFWYLLTNPAYAGSAGFPAIVCRAVFEQAQRRLRLRRRR